MINSCSLRPLAENDLAMVLSWRNEPAVRAVMFNRHEIGMDEHRDWFATASRDETRRLLLVEEAGVPIGYVQFANVRPGGVSDWGFYATPGARKGTGRRLGAAALNHAFGALGLHKVCGQALASNTASIRMHCALGFCQEGILRQHHPIDDRHEDVICFGLLSHEWD